ncbi:MAG: hypothetical protein NW206_11710 [Hyphomonadaceae bacterium]|nr:hypothetical protein [Hyphomonadaceae bacterium]
MTDPRAIRLQESQTGARKGERVIEARYEVVGQARGTWRAKLMATLTAIACFALAGLALPPLMVGAYLLNVALTR